MVRKDKSSDNTTDQQQQQVFRKSQELEAVLDELSTIVIMIDETYTVKRVNKRALVFSGKKKYNQVLEKKCYKVFFHRKSPCEFCPRAEGGATLAELYEEGFSPEQEINTAEGETPISKVRYFQQKQYTIKAPEGHNLLVEMLTDISDRRELEEEQTRNAKLIALGTTVQTVAHELGNPLTGMRLTLDALFSRKDLDEQLRRRLQLMRDDLTRANHIVSEISSFGRRKGYRLVEVELLPIIKDSLKESRRFAAVKFHSHFDWQVDKKVKILGHGQKLMQVFQNLFQNSLQAFAMRTSKEGRKPPEPNLWIAASFQMRHLDLLEKDQQGRILEVQIIDNAGGIPKEVLARVFDPFFTTKRGIYKGPDMREGSGLGLFVTHKILEEHKATIEVESKGAYTRFSIFFVVEDA